MSLKIVVCGSNSYICRNFCFYIKNILKKDIYIIGISKNESRNLFIDKFVQHDLSESFPFMSVQQTVSDKIPDLIINFASYSHVDKSFKSPSDFLKNNLGIARSLSKIIKIPIIHISTDEVEVEGGPTSPYSWSKLAQEEILMKEISSKSNVHFIRLNNVYGTCNLTNKDLYPTQPIIWNQLNKLRDGEINEINLVSNYSKISRNFLPVIIVCEYLSFYIYNMTSLGKMNKIYIGRTRTIKKFIKDYLNKWNLQNPKFRLVEPREKTDYSYPVYKEEMISKRDYIKYL